jgi:hypothetical protein
VGKGAAIAFAGPSRTRPRRDLHFVPHAHKNGSDVGIRPEKTAEIAESAEAGLGGFSKKGSSAASAFSAVFSVRFAVSIR